MQSIASDKSMLKAKLFLFAVLAAAAAQVAGFVYDVSVYAAIILALPALVYFKLKRKFKK